MALYDLIVKNGTVVLPGTGEVRADVGISEGKVAALADDSAAGISELIFDFFIKSHATTLKATRINTINRKVSNVKT